MKNPLPSLASILFLSRVACSLPPATFEIGATAPDAAGGHLAYSRYLGESAFLQARLEEGVLRLDSRLSGIHHGLLALGLEEEASSHLFFRLSLGGGIGMIYNPGEKRSDRSDWLATTRIAPEVAWFPFGRFGVASVGLNLGINLQHRQSLTDHPLPRAISREGAQIFAGVVL